jgi:hypothetical protein
MPEKKRVFTPSRSYDIQLKIKDLDYTNDLQQVRFVSSIAGAYQIVTLDISLDPNDIILENIFGKEPLNLQIKMIGRGIEIIPSEHLNIELMYLDSDSSMPMKSGLSEGSFKDRTIVSFTTVPRKPFKAMSTIVNDVFINKTPTEIVSQLVSSTGCQLVMDSDEKNNNKIDQVMIPPTSLYKTIKFLDDNFGLYEGASNLGFCQFDNKFYVMNLTKRMDKTQTFTIYHLATDSDDTNKIIEKSSDGKNFFTYNELQNGYTGNALFASLAKKANIILKPTNTLFKTKVFDLADICKDYGAIAKNQEVDSDPELNNRETYVTSDPGYGEGNLAISPIARKIIGMATLEFDLEKDLPVLSLINVGEPVKVITKTAEYIPLSGKYLLKSSDITFNRPAADWQATCHIVLMRSNKTI